MGLLDGLQQFVNQLSGTSATQGAGNQGASGAEESNGSYSNSIWDKSQKTEKQDVEKAADELMEAWIKMKEIGGDYVNDTVASFVDGAKDKAQDLIDDIKERNEEIKNNINEKLLPQKKKQKSK